MPTEPLQHFERFVFNRLVRDKVVGHCRQQDCRTTFHTITGTALQEALRQKLVEESAEVVAAADDRTETIKELADLKEVIEELMRQLGISPDEVAAAQAVKRAAKGTFAGGYFITTNDVPVGHPDIPGFLAQPEKFKHLGLVE
ncbi:MAG: nucleoside triphosphate pyrophosphohydrolase [Alphaproteobacteria bacterium]|jgi:predicted house-cleaning noncanonical NTP pyrophosphatase (MazG superfamily)|nr:nucleoside triphosphate pyrophosphohydrolase [Alphaproteobacteria bacterium]